MVRIRVRPYFLPDIAPFSVHFFFNQGGNLWFTCISSTHRVQSFHSGNKILIKGTRYLEVSVVNVISYFVSEK